ncbi:hypothetical protein GEMRC1_014198 [Eukaryota sp. GEM-RC1]
MPFTPVDQMTIRNIQPRQRSERQSTINREDLEKQRLRNRKEDYFHYEGSTDPLHVVNEDAPLYLNEANRFSDDFVSIQQEEKARKLARQQAILEKKRHEQLYREQANAEANIAVYEREEQKLKTISQRSSKHSMSPAYNPITLEYDSTSEGKRLRKRDLAAFERSQDRAANLYCKTNSHFNPITGEEIRAFK